MNITIRIGKKGVGKNRPVYIIAEIGSNHDGDLEKAKELIKAAKSAGADAVKLQSFTAEGLINPLKPNGSGGWELHPDFELLKRLSIPERWHSNLMEFAETVGITLISAPFDEGRADLLHKIGVEAFKIASGDLTNEPLLRKIASYQKPLILSTGASYLEEVKRAVEVIFSEGNRFVALLHCASLYPPGYEDVNLKCVATLAREFRCPAGLSDHTPGYTMSVAAVAMGAAIIEKHITLDRNSDGPDHIYAMEVEDFEEMVTQVRNLETAFGDGIKKPSKNELSERVGARRGIYANVDIRKGTVIAHDMVKVVRHAYGLEPRELQSVIGKAASRDLAKDMPVRKDDICA